MKKILYALLSIVIAVGLWVYVITAVNPEWEETYYNIPVVLENESALHDRGLMIVADELPKVTLKLLGNRSDLMNLSKDNITLVADLSKIYDTGDQQVRYSIFYSNIPSNSVEVISQTPQEITLNVTERASKDVPVRVFYEGAVPEGFRTDRENQTLDHKTVRVIGPASVINRIDYARVQVDLEGQTETIDQSYIYTLCDRNGEPVDAELVKTDVTEIRLNLKIQRYKEIKLKLDVVAGGGASRENTLIAMDMETIQVSGTEQQLNELGNSLDLGEIRLGEEYKDTVKEFEIKLPEGVENLTGKDTVSVSIQFQDLITKTIYVTKIEPKNVPDGMAAKVITKQMPVTVRGPKVQVEAISADDLTVHVDFSDPHGQDSYKALVYVDSGTFDKVGAVGTYHVLADVIEEVVEENLEDE